MGLHDVKIYSNMKNKIAKCWVPTMITGITGRRGMGL